MLIPSNNWETKQNERHKTNAEDFDWVELLTFLFISLGRVFFVGSFSFL